MNPFRGRTSRGLLITASVAAVVGAPLAVATSSPSDAVTISGARSLSDSVSVNYNGGRHPEPDRSTQVHLLAFNDFHGNLEPAALNIYGQFAGGAAYLAKAVKDKQAAYGRNSATVFAGDNIGASPLATALFREEPATVVANLMHVDYASVGNHEFDKGYTELLRIQRGGCAADGCNGAPYQLANGRTTNRYPGADFQYLSANVLTRSGRTLLPAYGIKRFPVRHGRDVAVGFIGETLQATPTIVTPAGVEGLTFAEEAEAANKAARDLRRKGVRIPVLVIHQGGFQNGTAALNGCAGNLAGSDIEKIAAKLDPSIKVIVSAHTHAEYRCTITTNGVTRLVTSASSFGRVLSDITLTVDTRSGELLQADAANSVVANALNTPGTGVIRQDDPSKADPLVAKVVQQYVTAAAPLANRVIGRISGDLTRSSTGESTLGDVIADSQLAATAPASVGGSVIAFMNPGGIRADLLVNAISSGGEAPGEVTYGEAFTVQPFGNSLVIKTLTGANLRSLLEQQKAGCGGQTVNRTLQISAGFSYQQSATPLPAAPTAADCAAQIGEITLNGVPIDPAATYRVTMNSFLATGGDGFTVFNSGADPVGGGQDIDALTAYFQANPGGVAVPALNRITVKP
jgi:5'-nucleotidase